MDGKFNALLSVGIVPQVVEIIAENEKLDDKDAIKEFYNSKTYDALANEETKVWHYSPLLIYTLWKGEKETGEIPYPEEAA